MKKRKHFILYFSIAILTFLTLNSRVKALDYTTCESDSQVIDLERYYTSYPLYAWTSPSFTCKQVKDFINLNYSTSDISSLEYLVNVKDSGSTMYFLRKNIDSLYNDSGDRVRIVGTSYKTNHLFDSFTTISDYSYWIQTASPIIKLDVPYFQGQSNYNITISTEPLTKNNSDNSSDWYYLIDNNNDTYYTSAKSIVISDIEYTDIESTLSNIKIGYCPLDSYMDCLTYFDENSTYIDYQLYYDNEYTNRVVLPYAPTNLNPVFYALPLEFPTYTTDLSFNEDTNKLEFEFVFDSWINDKIVAFVQNDNQNYTINYSKYNEKKVYKFSVMTNNEISIEFAYDYNTSNILRTDTYEIEDIINEDKYEDLREVIVINDSPSNGGNLEGFSGLSGVFNWLSKIYQSISNFAIAFRDVLGYLYRKLNQTLRITIIFLFITAIINGIIRTIQRRS